MNVCRKFLPPFTREVIRPGQSFNVNFKLPE